MLDRHEQGGLTPIFHQYWQCLPEKERSAMLAKCGNFDDKIELEKLNFNFHQQKLYSQT
jgi:hypothetical protein